MANKIKSYDESELIDMFGLKRLAGNNAHPLMEEWVVAAHTELSFSEQELFNDILQEAAQKIIGWHEEDLKMKFISFVLRLGYLRDNDLFNTYFEKTISDTVEGHFLKTKTDFMVAKGTLDRPKKPYFHFQEYKPHKKPVGDAMGQLLEAFLIAQHKNNDGFPLYGCEIMGKYWNFVIFEQRTYCVSKTYDCTEGDHLLQIIAILRKFKAILEARLLRS
jgi:hypothetical protein